jgi:hypothetical protein
MDATLAPRFATCNQAFIACERVLPRRLEIPSLARNAKLTHAMLNYCGSNLKIAASQQ